MKDRRHWEPRRNKQLWYQTWQSNSHWLDTIVKTSTSRSHLRMNLPITKAASNQQQPLTLTPNMASLKIKVEKVPLHDQLSPTLSFSKHSRRVPPIKQVIKAYTTREKILKECMTKLKALNIQMENKLRIKNKQNIIHHIPITKHITIILETKRIRVSNHN